MRKIVAMAVVGLISLSTMAGFAAERETLESLRGKAVKDSVDLLAIDAGILTLEENVQSLYSSASDIWDLYDAYQKYEELYDKGVNGLTILPLIPIPPEATEEEKALIEGQNQQIELNNQLVGAYQQLQQLFFGLYGITSPSLSEEQIYDNFIYIATVMPMNLSGQANLLKIDRQRAEAGIKNGVETLWWNLGALRNQKTLTDVYSLLIKRQLEITEKKLTLGQASQLELDAKKVDYEQALANQRALDRGLENLEYRLRHLAGIAYHEAFSADITPVITASQNLKTYEEYLRLAQRTRVDAIRALKVVDMVKQEEAVMSSYISDVNSVKRLEVRLRRLEAEENYQKLLKALDSEIFGLYHDALTAKEELEAFGLKLQLANLDLKRIQALYNQGYLSQIDFEGARLMLVQAQIAYESAKYQYTLKLQQLDYAVTYGGSTGGVMQ